MASGGNRGPFLEYYESLDKFYQEALKKIATATKASNGLPSDRREDWDYYSSFSGFRCVAEAQADLIENLMTKLLRSNGIKVGSIPKTTSELMEMLTEANDQILEQVGTDLDEASGVKKIGDDKLLVEVTQKGMARISGSWNKSLGDKKAPSVKLLAAKHVPRPQIRFKDLIDNSGNPFVPRLTEKPHSKKPLSILVEYHEDGSQFYSHPYLFEIDHFRPENWQMSSEFSPENRKSDRIFKYVDDPKELRSMIGELNLEKVLGVDAEHHGYRSFLGLTSLLQISSSTTDYVIDPFPIWEAMTELNSIFANPKILKILHGCGSSDVGWLQRDFSLYFVNIFDTYVAAKTLGYPRGCLSLAFLLHKYLKVTLNKKFQLTDWRIRPLSQDMIDYAKSDTMHLIDLFKHMKNDLLEKGNENKNLLASVYAGSNDLCKFRYEKPKDNYVEFAARSRFSMNSRQMFALKEIFEWRDKIARQEDESIAYVLPSHMLLKICSELPREMQGILACCNPVPPLVKQSLGELHAIILKARNQELKAVSGGDQNAPKLNGSLTVIEDQLLCPLDLSHHQEEGLSSLLDGSLKVGMVEAKDEIQPRIQIFAAKGKRTQNQPVEAVKNFLSPFQRLELLHPFLETLSTKSDSNAAKTDDERIQSIKEHFAALTAMTVEEKEEEVEEAVEAPSSEEEEESGQPLDSCVPQEEKIQKFREQPAKRKSNENECRERKKPKFTGGDFSAYNTGVKYQNPTEFNPAKDFEKNQKRGGGRQKQRYKPGGKSATFKRK